MKLIQIHPRDNVAVALDTVAQGETISLAAGDLGKIEVTALEEIPKGHKIALTDIVEGGTVIKYGTVIAIASTAIKKGSWIHTHNAHTGMICLRIQTKKRPRKHSTDTADPTAVRLSATKSGSFLSSAA